MPFHDMQQAPVISPFPGSRGRVIHGDHMTVVDWVFEAGSPLPAHSHPNEQISNLIEGRYEFTVGSETRVIETGAVVVIPGGTVHSGRALTRCRFIDVFCPVREDYR